MRRGPGQGGLSPAIDISAIGRESEPLITIDGFAADPDALRAAAISASFRPAENHYPGIRAPLPESYLRDQRPVIAEALERAYGHCGDYEVVDASFSMVTTPPSALAWPQRLPHCDAFGAGRIALLHYLSPMPSDGTAFFRHRWTGHETIDEARASAYFKRLRAEIGAASPPAEYIAGDTALFERTALVEARYNRALLYRSYLLHSGAIAPDAALSPDPAIGRLTVTAFLALV